MSGLTPEDIAEMKRIKNLLNGIGDEEPSPYQKKPQFNESSGYHRVAAPAPLVGDDIDEMRRFVTAVNDFMPEVIEESIENSEFREAIITEKVNNNTIQVGSWQIEKLLLESNGKKEPHYQISNVITKQGLDPVFVYEAAQAILKHLNQGHNLHDKEIDAIMELDKDYQRLRMKALEEKAIWQRSKKSNLEWKQQLYESKFNSSQYQALYIKERIKNFFLK
jgi:hypothetical protein